MLLEDRSLRKNAQPVNVGQQANFCQTSISNPIFIGLEKTSSYMSVQFFFASHWSSSIGKPRMTLVSFVMITESQKVY